MEHSMLGLCAEDCLGHLAESRGKAMQTVVTRSGSGNLWKGWGMSQKSGGKESSTYLDRYALHSSSLPSGYFT
jgi:hypothetical protein